ncbi:MAG: DUF2142 domain-containing protein [Tepidisphaeraceae bacterium]
MPSGQSDAPSAIAPAPLPPHEISESAPRTAARWFLPLAWTFGLVFALITPPYQVPDEYDHFYRSYQVSEGHFTQTQVGDQIGGYLPRSLIDFQNRVSQDIPHHPQIKQNLHTLLSLRGLPLNVDDREFVLFPWYSPTNYFPQAAAIAISRHLGASPLAITYAGRIGNLFVWSLLVYSALRIIPLLDWTIFLLALMPMSLSLAASMSADAMVNGICFLFAAVVLRFAVGDDRPIGPARLAALFFLIAALALAKTAYLPLALLLLIIPPAKFGGLRRYFLACGSLAAVALLVSIAWTLYTYRDFVNPDSSPHAQAMFLLHHPLSTAADYVGQLCSLSFLSSIIGKLGWYDTRLARPMVALYLLVLIYTTRIGGWPTVRLNPRQKWIIAAAAVCIWLAVFTLVDLAFTRVGNPGVTSLQGRYMIPLTPLVFLLLYPAPSIRRRERGPLFAAFSGCFCLYVVGVLVWRFYVV